MDGQSVKTTERGGARDFEARQARKGTQYSTYLLLTVSSRLIHPIGGRSAAWRIERVVSENPDDNSTMPATKAASSLEP
jgi:hypothetical protein